MPKVTKLNYPGKLPNESIQQYVERIYQERGYVSDNLEILAFGICEEAGEIAASMLDLNPSFKPKPGRDPSLLLHELKDLIVYVAAMGNAAGFDLGI